MMTLALVAWPGGAPPKAIACPPLRSSIACPCFEARDVVVLRTSFSQRAHPTRNAPCGAAVRAAVLLGHADFAAQRAL
eukprot:9196339-Alexandrium_andersonii.AAC.1